MDRENGGRKRYEEGNGEYYNDPRLAYEDRFPQNNVLTPYSEAHHPVEVLDEMMATQQQQQQLQLQQQQQQQQQLQLQQQQQQQQLLDSNSSFNLVNLLNMPTSFPAMGLDNGASGFEPMHFLFNQQPEPSSPLFQIHEHGAYGYGAGVLTSEAGMIAAAAHDIDYNQQGEMFEFSPTGSGLGLGLGGGQQHHHLKSCPKNFVTERQRRQTFNDKFQHLKSLLPNPNKNDRASIVGDAIEYIKELKRTVNELKILVEKKRCLRQRNKRCKNTIEEDVEEESPKTIKSEQVSLRSSWLQRKCKDTEIDVRIVDDEVIIKMVQRKKMLNCLLYVSRSFDELQLDLQHVTGGHVGDYYSFLFNTKIFEGSSTYAAAIANKLIEVVEGHYAAYTY